MDDLLDSPYYQQLLSDEYRIGHILLTIDENADDAAVEAARAEARRIVAELREGANFREMAIANSSASTALEGGDLGWRKAGELPSRFFTIRHPSMSSVSSISVKCCSSAYSSCTCKS